MQNAIDQARHLARTLATGNIQPFCTVPWFWSDFGQLKLQIAGLSVGADAQILRQGPLVAIETIARRLLDGGLAATEADIMAGPDIWKKL